ncbi:hypothetical protein JXD38_03305, partial [candidate division WOR-3 bacterium]|nr:hypothetical protein [candidate division WOR-3 bacterium]
SVWPWDVALGESKVYVGASDGWGVDVYDLTNPGQPVRRGRASAPTDIRRLCYSNGHLYAALWDAGVAVYETTMTAIEETPGPRTEPVAFSPWPSVTTNWVRFAASGMACGLDIAVFDVTGKRLRNVPVLAETKGGATLGKASFASLPVGVYVIRVCGEGTNLTAKVVRTKGR